MNFAQWTPTVVVIATLIGMGYVAQATLKRHEGVIAGLVDKVQGLETDVAVLKATQKPGDQ
jgi:hypothetical protein